MSDPAPARPLRFWLSLSPVLLCFALAIWQMRYDWTYDETYNYGWVVTPLMAYLFSVRWRDRPAPRPLPLAQRSIWGWVIISLLLPACWLIREANPEWRLVSMALAILAITSACLWLRELGGTAWMRHFMGALAFFAVSIPWPSELEKITAHFLMPVNAAAALEALQLLGVPATRAGNLIQLPGGGILGVEEACSGIRSLQATLMMALFLGELHRLRWVHRGLLLLIGIIVALLTNALRTIWLSKVGAQDGLSATHHLHDRAGLIVLAINSGLLLALAALLERKFPRPTYRTPSSEALQGYSRTYSRGPSFCLAAMILMIPFTAYWYGRNEAAQPDAWTLTQPTEAPAYQSAYINNLTTKMLRYTDGWSAKWQTPNQRSFHGFYLEWEKGKSPPDNMNVHTPGGCLLNLGIEQMEEYPKMNLEIQGHLMPIRFLRFRDRNRPLFMAYFVAENEVLGRAADVGSFDFSYTKRLRSVLLGRRNPGQRLVEIGLWDEPDPGTAQKILTDFLTQHVVWNSKK
jgi:exosortase